MQRTSLGVVLCALVLAACSNTKPAGTTLKDHVGEACAVSTVTQCVCADGQTGNQSCQTTGVYGACICLGGSGAGGGVGVGTAGTIGVGAAGTLGAAGDGATAGAGGASGAGASGAGGASGTGAAGSGGGGVQPTMLPTHKMACPTITEGDVMFLGHKAKVWVGTDGLSKLGPLVIYWHGTCSSPMEVLAGIGMTAINEIKAQGGMVVALYSEYDSPNNFCNGIVPSSASCPGTSTGNGVWCYEDFDTTDEIVACAIEQVGIDTRHIHAAGMSAGGLQTVAMSYARSGYLASVTSYSGGVIQFVTKTTSQDPTNKFAAMIVHGGANDGAGGVTFQSLSEAYQTDLKAKGQFSFICDHGGGHTIPNGIGDSTWLFFEDHPFGVAPEPYATMLPSTFPAYCKLP